MNAKTIEIIAHWTISLGITLLGSFIGATAIVALCGMGVFAVIGNVTTLLTNAQVQVLYGLLALIAVHLCTGGWWLRSCLNFIDEMNALHAHTLSRMNPQVRKALDSNEE